MPRITVGLMSPLKVACFICSLFWSLFPPPLQPLQRKVVTWFIDVFQGIWIFSASYLVPATCSDVCCAKGSLNKGSGQMNPCLHSQERFKKNHLLLLLFPCLVILIFSLVQTAASSLLENEWISMRRGKDGICISFFPKLWWKCLQGSGIAADNTHIHNHTPFLGNIHIFWKICTMWASF